MHNTTLFTGTDADSSVITPPFNTPTEGWEQFYLTLMTSGNIPDPYATTISSDTAVFRGNYLDIADIQSQIAASGKNPLVTTIYTDILNVPSGVVWTLKEAGLAIYARYILLPDDEAMQVNMDFSVPDQEDASLVIFAGGMSGSISVTAITTGTGENIIINNNKINPGIGISSDGQNGLRSQVLPLSAGFPAIITDEQENYLFNSLVMGALSSGEYPEIAVDILVWVNKWAGAASTTNSSDLAQLFFQSSNLASLFQAQIIASANGTTYVPFLSSAFYSGMAKNMSSALLACEQNYITLFTTTVVTDDLIQVAKTLQSVYDNNLANYNDLLVQAKTDYNNAVVAEQTATINFKQQKLVSDFTGTNLTIIGIPDFEQQQKYKAALEFGKAILIFAAAAAGIAIGDEAEAPAAAEAGIDAAKALAGTEKAVSAMVQLKKLLQLMDSLSTLAQTLYTISVSIETNPDSPVDPAAGAVPMGSSDAINGVAAWSVYKIQSDSSIQPLVDLGVEYASDYKDAIDILVVYGQALSAAQLALIKASQNVLSLAMQVYYAKSNLKRIKALVSSMVVGQDSALRLQQLFYQKYLNDKLSLFTILSAYRATYFYWALTPSGTNVSLLDLKDITSDLDTAVGLDLDYYQALINFGGGPQPMQLLTVQIDDPIILKSLQETGNTQWIIDLDNPKFAGLDRVRFTTVRIWLEGESLYPKSPAQVSIGMKTSGNYYDRYNSSQFQLNSKAFSKIFQYTVNDAHGGAHNFIFDDGSVGTVVIDGSASTGMGNDYFEPTPFSEWRISLKNDNINYANITSVTMQFSGSVIPGQ